MVRFGVNDRTVGKAYLKERLNCTVGKDTIYGVIYKPKTGNKWPLILFAHELGTNHSSGSDYAEYFASKGICVYTFDFRGGGYACRSGNDMSKMSVATERDDLLAVLSQSKTWDFVETEKIVLLGASQGGYVSTMAAIERPKEIAGLICIYPAYLIQDTVRMMFRTYGDIPEKFSFLGWFTAGKIYAADVWDYDIYNHMEDFKKPVLLLHGDRDGIVSCHYSQRAAETFPDAEYHVIRSAGHGFYGSSFREAVTYMDDYLKTIL